MERKGIEKGEKKRSSKDLVMIVIAAMVVMAAMAAFIPTAAAVVVNITADNYAVNATTGYDIMVNTTGYTNTLTINITLPAGYTVNETMSTGDLLAEVYIYEKTTTGWLMSATFEAGANPLTQVNATAYDNESSSLDYIINNVNYSEGGTTEITGVSTAVTGGMNLDATVILPTADVNGSLNASITLLEGHNITNVSISIKGFVKNPSTAKDYVFVAVVNGVEVTDTVTVTGTWLKGDLNHNGDVADAADVTMMLQASVGDLAKTSDFDLNGNGDEADAADVTAMLQASVGDLDLNP